MQYLEDTSASEPGQDHQASTSDFSKLIEDEVSHIKDKKGNMFEWHKTNVHGLVYISLTSAAGNWSIDRADR